MNKFVELAGQIMKRPITLMDGIKLAGAVGAKNLTAVLVTESVWAGRRWLETAEYWQEMIDGVNHDVEPVTSYYDLAITGDVEAAMRAAAEGGNSGIAERCREAMNVLNTTYENELTTNGDWVIDRTAQSPLSDIPESVRMGVEIMNEACKPVGDAEKIELFMDLMSRDNFHVGVERMMHNLAEIKENSELLWMELTETAVFAGSAAAVDWLLRVVIKRGLWAREWSELNNREKVVRGALDCVVVGLMGTFIQ